MKYRLVMALIAVGAFLLSSCVSTDIAGIWKDQSVVIGPVKRIMVVGIFKEEGIQKSLENAIVKEINDNGGAAFPSYKVLGMEKLSDETFLATKLEEVRAEAVLIVRATDRDKIDSYTPGEIYDTPPVYYHDLHVFAKRAQNDVIRVVSPSPIERRSNEFNYQKFTIETNVYSTATKKLVLSLASDTGTFYKSEKVVKNLSETITKNLLEQNIILK